MISIKNIIFELVRVLRNLNKYVFEWFEKNKIA